MKNTILLILIGLSANTIFAQVLPECHSKELIVTANNLNFRSAQNTSRQPIGQLENSELLTLIDFEMSKFDSFWGTYSSSWLKVKRNRTGEVGYVYGRYVRPQEKAYMTKWNDKKLISGICYGICEENNQLIIEKIENPSDTILDHEKYTITICSQGTLHEGEIIGSFNLWSYIHIDSSELILNTEEYSYGIKVTKNDNPNYRKNTSISFQKYDNDSNLMSSQDLGDCMALFGNLEVEFIGDITNDGHPELVLSEGNEQGQMMIYYFRSNHTGLLELKSCDYLIISED